MKSIFIQRGILTEEKELKVKSYYLYYELSILHRCTKNTPIFGEGLKEWGPKSIFIRRGIGAEEKELKAKSYYLYYELSILHYYAPRPADKMKKLPPK